MTHQVVLSSLSKSFPGFTLGPVSTTFSSGRTYGLLARYAFFPARTGAWVLSLLALEAFAALCVSARWRFHQKLGQLLPLVVVIIPLLIVVLLDRRSGLIETLAWWSTGVGRLVLASLLAAATGALLAVTIWWVGRAETYRLID
jgi:hypothetical protein